MPELNDPLFAAVQAAGTTSIEKVGSEVGSTIREAFAPIIQDVTITPDVKEAVLLGCMSMAITQAVTGTLLAGVIAAPNRIEAFTALLRSVASKAISLGFEQGTKVMRQVGKTAETPPANAKPV